MPTKPAKRSEALPAYQFRSPKIPLAAIRRYAHRIAELFHPEKIILFGSYAYGTPDADSDVDLLVVMPASNEINQAIRIQLAFQPVFPLDLIVRTPKRLQQCLEDGDWFMREIMEKGKVLYAKRDGKVGAKGRGRLQGRKRRSGVKRTG